MYELLCNSRTAGRFSSKASAQDEEERLWRLAKKRGEDIATEILWHPDTEEEANEAEYRARVGSM